MGREITGIGNPNATDQEIKDEVKEMSALAQRAENSGDRVVANAAHNVINAGLEQLRRR